MSSDALWDLRAWFKAMLDAVGAAVPEAHDWVIDHVAELRPVDFAGEYGRAPNDAHRLALKIARHIAATVLARTPEGHDLMNEDQRTGQRWEFVHLVAVEAAKRAMAAPEVARWGGLIPGNMQTRRTEAALARVEQALRTARPGETTSETLMRAGVSRRRGYELMEMTTPAKPRR